MHTTNSNANNGHTDSEETPLLDQKDPSYSQKSHSNKNDAELSFDMKRWQDGGISSFSQTCFAEYWDTLPRLIHQKIETKTNESEIFGNANANDEISIEVDPYNFQHRMALGKYLIEQNSNTGGEKIWGRGSKMHWFWGYLAQLDWQRRSGRLTDLAVATASQAQAQSDSSSSSGIITFSDEISIDSWFGYMNMNFIVALYCGAAKVGLVPKISWFSLKRNGNETMDVEQNEGFLECVNHWASFWSGPHQEYIKAYSSLLEEEATTIAEAKGGGNTNADAHDIEKDKLLCRLYDQLWDTHTQIIKTSLPHATRMENLMPELETKFALGWCHMVELLAAMSWTLLSLDALMEHGAGFLPTIVLTDPEALEWLKATEREDEHLSANNMINMSAASDMFLACEFLRRLAFWNFERKRLPYTLKTLTTTSSGLGEKFRVILRVNALVMFPHSSREWFLAILVFLFLASLYINKLT